MYDDIKDLENKKNQKEQEDNEYHAYSMKVLQDYMDQGKNITPILLCLNK